MKAKGGVVVGHVDGHETFQESGERTRTHLFYGWLFLSNGARVSSVDIFYGSRRVGSARYGGWREDVAMLFPGHPEASKSAFEALVTLPAGIEHPFTVLVVDEQQRSYRAFQFDLRKKFRARHHIGSPFRNRFYRFYSSLRRVRGAMARRRSFPRPLKILVMGHAKNGTTALFFKIRNSILRERPLCFMRSLFEPFEYDTAQEKKFDVVLAKVLLYQGNWLIRYASNPLRHRVDYECFNHFDKKILIVRDPRDRIVSHLLFVIRESSFRSEGAKLESFLQRLRCKERDPGSVTFLGLVAEAIRLETGVWDVDAWRGAFQRYFSFGLEFHERHPEFHVIKYEDFVDGKIAGLQSFLGFPLTGGSKMDFTYEVQVRTASYGYWKNWFLPEDVDFFRPIFSEYMERYQYAGDWDLALRPVLIPAHGSEYVKRIVAEKDERERRHGP